MNHPRGSTLRIQKYLTSKYTISSKHKTIPGTAIREMRFALSIAWRWSAIDSCT